MSQPRQVPTHSSSPSKSSLRRTSGPHNSQSRSLLPSPHFDDDPIVASHQSASASARQSQVEYSEHAVIEADDAGEESEQFAVDDKTDAIPSFQPFFTLIEDSVTNEHHHPTVHYIFADDDSDIIAEAACRSLETLDPQQQQEQANAAQHEPEDEGTPARLPAPTAGLREHYLVLDVYPRTHPPPQDSSGAPTTYEVTSAQSFSADWQVLRSSITAAPTMGDAGEDDTSLMLRIEGRGNTPGDAPATEKESMEEMIERFQRRLEDIRQVMEAGSVGGGGASGVGIGAGPTTGSRDGGAATVDASV
ncbi:hypothetical protein LTR10_019950 [Elasticomyces elasticus]|uniref:Uncharacterized protein n=1 Tax=Exophiala sideris TaxID=1016849 RepID=A0ABR0J9K6_9EURO|nr:hypothetical protein LTR10_019950 [Elasticomyces elasticus]KAK5022786.1 hypothetical protein LTS07_009764 [Exophiala sideris]KAK5026688.1 hypothetical protein LTR13_009912 [Exophiala sideris]KAK5059413.1 hypothetical protein LTR69_006002 [Exophiala sideris]KAK5177442.1 hypothetical protein LTR44_010058 [Eurotiomycetes sp. CCFEE 6388]